MIIVSTLQTRRSHNKWVPFQFPSGAGRSTPKCRSQYPQVQVAVPPSAGRSTPKCRGWCSPASASVSAACGSGSCRRCCRCWCCCCSNFLHCPCFSVPAFSRVFYWVSADFLYIISWSWCALFRKVFFH